MNTENKHNEMSEGLVEEESANYSIVIDNGVSNPIIAKTSSATIDTDKGFYSYSDLDGNLEMEWNLPQGYQFVDENGNVINATKIVLEKKKKEYPKTYEECCKVLEIEGNSLLINTKHITDYERGLGNLMGRFHRLIICRDAYWKIAGEEMGLGKPWEPDNDHIYNSIVRHSDEITKKHGWGNFNTFEFPTEEMRDAFYENFKEEIEQCKELL